MSKVTAHLANRIALGSGHIYCVEVTDSVKLTSTMTLAQVLTFIDTHAVAANILGRIKGGATLNNNEAKYTEKDDLDEVSKTITTETNVSLTTPMITFDLTMISKLAATAAYSTDGAGNEMVAIGGPKNDNGKKYILIFVHHDEADGDICVLIQGKNTAEIAIAFTKDAGSITSPTFTGEPFDEGGRSCFVVSRATPTTQATQTETQTQT